MPDNQENYDAQGEYQIEITNSALADLASHARFLANVSEPAAEKLIDDFYKETDILSRIPDAFPFLDFDGVPFHKYRKLKFSKYHIVIYRIIEKRVIITAVIDGRQDYAWLLADL